MYVGWQRTGNTIRAWRGDPPKYFHHCPSNDFLKISKTIMKIIENDEIVSKLDIYSIFEGKKLPNGSTFTRKTQSYKIDIVFSVLFIEGFIKKKGIKRRKEGKGRSPNAYIAVSNMKKLEKWLQKKLI